MKCSVIRNSNTQVIEGVFAENGKSSLLFKQLNEELQDAEKALDKWLLSYTPSFLDKYEGNRDENGEPMMKEVLEASPKGMEPQIEVLKKLVNPTAKKVPGGYAEIESSTKIANRVSDLVAQYRRDINAPEATSSVAADIGTTVHLLAELIFRDLNGEKMSDNKMLEEVKKHLVASEVDTKWVDSISNAALSNLKKGVRALYDDIQKTQKSIDPDQKAVILTEHIVHDKFRDLAGTIDAIIVYSNGQVGIIDFKSTFMSKRALTEDIAFADANKITQWNIQMSNYKEMLKAQLGISDLRETRIIPIGVDYKIFDKKAEKWKVANKIKTINMAGTIKSRSLDPIPLAGELTGKRITDTAIKRLESERERLTVQQRSLSDFKKRRLVEIKINKIDTILQSLRLYDDLKDVTQMASELLKEVNANMNVVKKKSKSYLTPAKIRTYINELSFLNEVLKTADPSSELFNKLKDSDEAELKKYLGSKNFQAVIKNAEAIGVSQQIGNTISTLEGMILDRMNEEAGEDIDLMRTGKKPGMMESRFMGLSEIDHPIFQRFNQLFTTARDVAERNLFEDIELIKTNTNALREWADSKGMSLQKVFDMIINDKTMSLKTEANSQFYEDLAKAKEKEDLKWLKKHTVFNEEKFKKDNERAISVFEDPSFDAASFFKMRQGKFEKDEDFKKRLDKKLEEEKSKFANRHDVTLKRDAYFTSVYLLPNTNSSQYVSDLYVEMNKPGNEALKNYYDMHVSLNEKFDEMTGTDKKIKRNFIANVAQDMADRFMELGFFNGVSELWNSFKYSMQVREQDEVLGVLDTATGKRLNSIPLLYTDEIRLPLDEKEENRIRTTERIKLQEEFKAAGKSIETRDFDNALESKTKKALAAAEYKKGKGIKSVDLSTSLIMFASSVHRYHAMKSIEDDVLTLRQILASGDVNETVVDEFGRPLQNKLMGKIAESIGVDISTIELFDKHVDYLLYGKKGSDILLGDTISAQKVMDKFHNYLSLKALALNLPLGAANFAGATVNLNMLAIEGRMFNQEDLKFASKIAPVLRSAEFEDSDDLTDDKIKAAYAVAAFRPATRDLSYEESEKVSASWGKQNMTWRNAFVLHRLGDDAIDNKILLSTMKSHGIDSTGKLVRRDRAKENFVPLMDMEFKKKKNGSLEIIHEGKDILPEVFTKVRNKVRKMAFNVKGSISEEQRAAIQGDLLGQMVMKFRTWMPGIVQSRFGKEKYDATLEDIEVGRYRVMLGNLFQQGIVPGLQNFSNVMVSAMPLMLDHYKGRMKGEYVEKLYQRFMTDNPQLKNSFTKEDFIKLTEDKLRATIVEARVAAALGALLLFLTAGLDWDDPDENNILTRNIFLMLKRTTLELSFTYSASSVLDIVKSPFAVFTLAKDLSKIRNNTIDEAVDIMFGENQNRDTTPIMYYTIKQVPVLNQILNVAGVFNPSIYETEKTTGERIIEDVLEDDEE